MASLLLAAAFVSPAAQAEAVWDGSAVRVTPVGNKNADQGVLIPREQYGTLLEIASETGGWAHFIAPADGTYHLSVMAPGVRTDSFSIEVTNASTGHRTSLKYHAGSDVQVRFIPDVKKGDRINWWVSKGNGVTLRDSFLMVVCFDGYHQLAGEPVVLGGSCTEALTMGRVCSICGYEEITETRNAPGHDFSGKQVIREATCTTAGMKGRICRVCGEQKDISYTAPLGHKKGREQVATPATCVSTGESVVKCTRCDAVLSSRLLPPTGKHTPSEPKVYAGVNENGFEHVTCAHCAATLKIRLTGPCTHRRVEYTESWKADGALHRVGYCKDCHALVSRTQPWGLSIVTLALTGVIPLLAIALGVLIVLHLRKPAAPEAAPAERREN